MRAFLAPWLGPRDAQRAARQSALRHRVGQTSPLRIVLGAGPIASPEWITTNADTLDVCRRQDWKRIFGPERADVLLAEHVWEHLSLSQARQANRNCFKFLKSGGRLRLAVPDGLHPDPKYREHVRPGGSGPGAEDHKVLYDFRSLTELLEQAGFHVDLLEYWNTTGQFIYRDWSSAEGQVRRSKRYDPRNQDGSLTYTSLIVDARKP